MDLERGLREIFILLQEALRNMELMNSANDISQWKDHHIEAAIKGISGFHSIYYNSAIPSWIPFSHSSQTMSLMRSQWIGLAQHARQEFDWFGENDLKRHILWPILQKNGGVFRTLPQTLIHGDFNPRNLAFRKTPEGVGLCF